MDIQVNDYVLEQREDGMYNAKSLLKQWVNKTGKNTYMYAYLERDKTKALVQGLSGTVIIRDVIKKTGRPTIVEWFNSVLFVDFVSWFMPAFDYEAISKTIYKRMFLQDSICSNIEELKTIMLECEGYEEAKLVKWLNYTIIGKTSKTLSVTDMDNITLEKFNSVLNGLLLMVKIGMINSFDSFGNTLKVFHEKIDSQFYK